MSNDPNLFVLPSINFANNSHPDLNSSSIIQPSGAYVSFQQAMQSGAIPTSLSSAGWSDEARPISQQTFLGASIRGFNMQGGFGDNSSSLTVDLVVDEYNFSDKTTFGFGDDPYHSGMGDNFVPPIPGSPVFFKFGPHFATVEEAFLPVFNEIYFSNTPIQPQPEIGGSATFDSIINGQISLSPNSYVSFDRNGQIINYSSVVNGALRGANHITFAGILQNYNQNRTSQGNPLYSVNVIDPREILSNVTLILNNYSGSTYGQSNILNIYGFLEYNATQNTKDILKAVMSFESILEKTVDQTGQILLTGGDKYYSQNPSILNNLRVLIKNLEIALASAKRQASDFRKNGDLSGVNAMYQQVVNLSNSLVAARRNLQNAINVTRPSFPITGTGFSRRSSQGIPYYRIQDAINALMEYHLELPEEYKNQGFGGRINFRGFNYVVDFGGLPELPEFYYVNFDEINLLELAMEVCDVTNRDLFVTLLPVINHPACGHLYAFNQSAKPQDIIAGIIRIDTIDRSEQPFYGAIKNYVDNLSKQNIFVENQDLGYELSNISTDRFIIGAQEVETHFFSSNADRDNLAFRITNQNGEFPDRPPGYQWTLEASFEQQILPYYGKLGQHAVTIPKGFGSYQQILLDATNLNAAGVGSYYVATEMELRCASISYDRWKDFLRLYNDVYMESVESDDSAEIYTASQTPSLIGNNLVPLNVNLSNNYVVTVPRSVFDTYAINPYDENGYPSSACNPPYGYPLYYKRMTQIGIPEAGLTDLFNKWNSLNTNLAQLKFANRKNFGTLLNSEYQRLKDIKSSQGLSKFEQDYFNIIERAINDPNPDIESISVLLEDSLKNNGKNVFPILPAIAKKNNANALKVYNFVKSVADECLGKKFLVKIPKEVNVYYENDISWDENNQYLTGPFGFRPRSTRNIPGYEFTKEFKKSYADLRDDQVNMMKSFLSSSISPNSTIFAGALSINYNPLSEKYESNYIPSNLGGYVHFDLYQNTLGASNIDNIRRADFNNLPAGIRQGLMPQDMTNFINDDGRISAYVRFDHSEDLTLEGFNDGDFTQQFIVGNYMIPDLTQALDNTGPDEFHTFPNYDNENNDKPPKNYSQLAFIKCSVEEELYMPPKTVLRNVLVHARNVLQKAQLSVPNKIFIACSGLDGTTLVPGTGVWVDSIRYYTANYTPVPSPRTPNKPILENEEGENLILDFIRDYPSLNLPGSTILNDTLHIKTDLDKLDTNHVYALITLPNKVIPTKDSRFRDGMNQTMTAAKFKHLMTMDVVRGLPGFDKPGTMSRPPVGNLLPSDLGRLSDQDTQIQAWFAMKKVQKQMSFGLPQQINAVAPSPVYPDLVALPLMSKDRCYGPWVSSQLDGQAYLLQNIGGKVDFIKDENLAPWNYGGYYLMNEAGRLQAEFSNSLLLFSERGSFTIPTIPQGNSLCKALTVGGPLVTSINVDVSTGGIKTTYQMDLYTASFGKLQKQKQEEISKISRERKKLNSERNALIRKGLGKNQSRRNFNQEYSNLAAGRGISAPQMGLSMMNTIAATITRENSIRYSPNLAGNFGSSNSNGPQGAINVSEYGTNASIQNDTSLAQTAQMFADGLDLAGNYYRSAAANISDIFAPYSNGYHPIMSYRPNMTVNANQSLLFIDDESPDLNGAGVIRYGGAIG